jgi:hypothetical protein
VDESSSRFEGLGIYRVESAAEPGVYLSSLDVCSTGPGRTYAA